MRRVIDVFKWPIRRKEDAVRADFEHRVDERLSTKVARSRQPEVRAKVLGDRLFGRIVRLHLDPCVSIVDTPHAVRQSLAHVTENDLQARVLVEKARAHQPQRVNGCLLAECPCRTEQPRMAVVNRRVLGERIAWMQVKRHVQRLDGRPKRAKLREVIVEDTITALHLRESVDERADEA